MIKITNGYLEMIGSNSLFQELAKKPFTARVSFYLAEAFIELQKKGELYLSQKQKGIEKYAKRHEADGGEGELKWKKGDMVSDGKSVSLNDVDGFVTYMKELTETEVNLGVNKIKFDLDKEPACTVEEMTLLVPLIEVKED